MQGKSYLSTVPEILFDFKKKIFGCLNKGKPSENRFNIAKNQEFELITSRHFKNLISPNPGNSQWSLIRSRNLKR